MKVGLERAQSKQDKMTRWLEMTRKRDTSNGRKMLLVYKCSWQTTDYAMMQDKKRVMTHVQLNAARRELIVMNTPNN